jgi:hypothetical protein
MPVPYLFVLVGMALLYLDLGGRLVVPRKRLVWWRWIGIAAAAGPGLAPVLGWAVGTLVTSGWWPFGVIASAYLVSFLVFALGAIDLSDRARSVRLRRVGYLGLLLLSLLPSWVLVVLAPAVALAGIGLARAKPEAPPVS